MTMDDILHGLVQASGFSAAELRGQSRHKSYAEARAVGIVLSQWAGYGQTEVGVFWRRNGSTVSKTVNAWQTRTDRTTYTHLLRTVMVIAERRAASRCRGLKVEHETSRPVICVSAAAATTREWSDWLSRPSNIRTEIHDEGQPNRQDDGGQRPQSELAGERQQRGEREAATQAA